MRPHTSLVHFDPCPGDPFRAIATPIYQTATFDQESAQEFGRFDYSRSGNPTRQVLEDHLARIDGGVRALTYSSGLAALAAVVRLLKPGDEVLANDDLYGGTYRLLSKVFEPRGIVTRYADLTDPGAAAAAITPRTKLIHTEALTNPLLRVCDVRALAKVAHDAGAKLSIDSTSLSPYLLRPLELGADFSVHSATKHLGGHSDVTAGAVVVRDAALAAELAFLHNAEGSALSPFDSFLLLRGIKTLGIRVDRQQASATKIAHWLAAHAEIREVLFPGLSNHPGDLVHVEQSSGPGTIVCFRTGSNDFSRRIAESLKLFNIAVSFGGVNSSVSLPCRMSHASIPAAVRDARAFPEDLVRLSIGIEDSEDLIEDLEHAIASAFPSVCCVPVCTGTGSPV